MNGDWASVALFFAEGSGGRQRADKCIETHAACVFLVGDLAYKIKKPVQLGYLDYSTLEKRRTALERECERNRQYSPETYIRVMPVSLAGDGSIRLGEGDRTIEYVLVMRRFADDSLLADKIGLVTGAFAEELGRTIARHHANAPVIQDAWPAGLEYVLQSNSERLSCFKAIFGAGKVAFLADETERKFAAQRELVRARQKAGFVRRCHGDLHLSNIFVENGKPVLFDCIEFDDHLSDIDIFYDLAFLVMDLLHHDKREGANRLLNGYLDEALRLFDCSLLNGLSLLPLFFSLRAAVRAHVSAQMEQPNLARSYFSDALNHLQPVSPRLIAVGGLSGTGKTFFARERAPSLGAAAGAIVVRSDETRKRIWKVRPTQRLPQSAYTEAEGRRVYGAMFDEAAAILGAGQSVILDAVFLRTEERAECRRLAESLGIGFEGYWLEAPENILRKRIVARREDASDADIAIMERQLAIDPGTIDWKRIKASFAAPA